jgi:ADP-ribose pyrophosphatase YjhB (NUDIX family)
MDILLLLNEIRAIAHNGLEFVTDPYDQERYQRLLELVSATYGEVLDLPPKTVQHQLRAEFGRITPKIGANAAIFDPQGRILLMQRAENQHWCLPGGWLEANETPAEAAIREAHEETGLTIHPLQFVDVGTEPTAAGLYTLVAITYLCEPIEGTLRGSQEGPRVQYWEIEAVPRWHGPHQKYAGSAYEAWCVWQAR